MKSRLSAKKATDFDHRDSSAMQTPKSRPKNRISRIDSAVFTDIHYPLTFHIQNWGQLTSSHTSVSLSCLVHLEHKKHPELRTRSNKTFHIPPTERWKHNIGFSRHTGDFQTQKFWFWQTQKCCERKNGVEGLKGHSHLFLLPQFGR